MNRTIALAAVLSLSASFATSCATVKPVVDYLPHAVAYAQDAEFVLTGIEVFEKGVFVASPNPALQTKVEKAIADARLALDAGIRICDAATELTNAQVDQAFANFKVVYSDIVALLGPVGLRRGEAGSRAGAAAGGVYVAPDPLIFSSAPGGSSTALGVVTCSPVCDACHVCTYVPMPPGPPIHYPWICAPKSPRPSGC